MTRNEVWQWLDETIGVILNGGPKSGLILEDPKPANMFEWACLLWSAALAPTPFDLDSPLIGYNSPVLFARAFKSVEQMGYIQVVDGGYLPTDAGDTLVDQIVDARCRTRIDMQPLPEADLQRFFDLLAGIIERANNLPEPPKPSFRLWVNFQWILPDSSPMLKLLRQLRALEWLRQDVHMAAWKPHGVNAHIWEIMTVLWREECTGCHDLPDTVINHGFTQEETQTAFAELIRRNWIEPYG